VIVGYTYDPEQDVGLTTHINPGELGCLLAINPYIRYLFEWSNDRNVPPSEHPLVTALYRATPFTASYAQLCLPTLVQH
jgi:hypothetical protein